MSQKTQIQDIDGSCGVDLIGRFENLENDLRDILHKIGFDKIVHTPKKANVSNKTDSENYVFEKSAIQKMNTLFADDLALFHYTQLQV
jgi:chemotaxis regulatin CheY-phosphate phosphatase CheZ